MKNKENVKGVDFVDEELDLYFMDAICKNDMLEARKIMEKLPNPDYIINLLIDNNDTFKVKSNELIISKILDFLPIIFSENGEYPHDFSEQKDQTLYYVFKHKETNIDNSTNNLPTETIDSIGDKFITEICNNNIDNALVVMNRLLYHDNVIDILNENKTRLVEESNKLNVHKILIGLSNMSTKFTIHNNVSKEDRIKIFDSIYNISGAHDKFQAVRFIDAICNNELFEAVAIMKELPDALFVLDTILENEERIKLSSNALILKKVFDNVKDSFIDPQDLSGYSKLKSEQLLHYIFPKRKIIVIEEQKPLLLSDDRESEAFIFAFKTDDFKNATFEEKLDWLIQLNDDKGRSAEYLNTCCDHINESESSNPDHVSDAHDEITNSGHYEFMSYINNQQEKAIIEFEPLFVDIKKIYKDYKSELEYFDKLDVFSETVNKTSYINHVKDNIEYELEWSTKKDVPETTNINAKTKLIGYYKVEAYMENNLKNLLIPSIINNKLNDAVAIMQVFDKETVFDLLHDNKNKIEREASFYTVNLVFDKFNSIFKENLEDIIEKKDFKFHTEFDKENHTIKIEKNNDFDIKF